MDTTHLIALGVIVQLGLSFAHHFVKSPERQAQLDAIEAKISVLLDALNGKDTAPK